jgi:transcriptional regulator with PAS, ATPase and Fis domain
MQAKLLRTIQDRRITRVGGETSIPVGFRLVCATHRDLKGMVAQGSFREDLFYRLNIFRIELPPLRDIPKDIPMIARHLVAELNESLGTAVKGINDEAIRIFQKYTWPGNIRELRNVLERTLIINRHGEIQKSQLPLYLVQNKLHLLDDLLQLKEDLPGKLELLLQEAEKEIILKTLAMTNNNKRQAAHLLGIHRSALYQKLKKHQLEARCL